MSLLLSIYALAAIGFSVPLFLISAIGLVSFALNWRGALFLAVIAVMLCGAGAAVIAWLASNDFNF